MIDGNVNFVIRTTIFKNVLLCCIHLHDAWDREHLTYMTPTCFVFIIEGVGGLSEQDGKKGDSRNDKKTETEGKRAN